MGLESEATMKVGDLVAKKLDDPQRLLGIVIEREPAPEAGVRNMRFADAIIVREYNGRITRWGEAWLEVVSGASN